MDVGIVHIHVRIVHAHVGVVDVGVDLVRDLRVVDARRSVRHLLLRLFLLLQLLHCVLILGPGRLRRREC